MIQFNFGKSISLKLKLYNKLIKAPFKTPDKIYFT